MNRAYPELKRRLLLAGVDLAADDLRAVIVDLDEYAFDPAHVSLEDLPPAARVAVSDTITGRAVSIDGDGRGVLDADDTLIPYVAGDPAEAVVVYRHAGTEGASSLLWFVDTAADGVTPMSLVPNGGNVRIEWSDGSARLLSVG